MGLLGCVSETHCGVMVVVYRATGEDVHVGVCSSVVVPPPLSCHTLLKKEDEANNRTEEEDCSTGEEVGATTIN